MRKYIKKLQSKEEFIRKQILAGALIVSMSFVGFVWVLNLGLVFNHETKQSTEGENIKPFKLFTNSIGDAYKNISASVGKISDLKSQIEKVEKVKKVEVNNEKQVDLIPVEYSNNQ